METLEPPTVVATPTSISTPTTSLMAAAGDPYPDSKRFGPSLYRGSAATVRPEPKLQLELQSAMSVSGGFQCSRWPRGPRVPSQFHQSKIRTSLLQSPWWMRWAGSLLLSRAACSQRSLTHVVSHAGTCSNLEVCCHYAAPVLVFVFLLQLLVWPPAPLLPVILSFTSWSPLLSLVLSSAAATVAFLCHGAQLHLYPPHSLLLRHVVSAMVVCAAAVIAAGIAGFSGSGDSLRLVSALVYHDPNSTATFRVDSAHWEWGVTSFAFTAPTYPTRVPLCQPVVLPVGTNMSDPIANPYLGRLIVPAMESSFCYYEPMLRHCQEVGCAGIVSADGSGHLVGFTATQLTYGGPSTRSDIRVPLILIDGNGPSDTVRKAFEAAQHSQQTFVMTVSSATDTNPWADAWFSVWFTILYRVWLAGFALSCTCLSGHKLYMFIQTSRADRVSGLASTGGAGRVRRSFIPIICLTIECAANIVRTIYFAVDPHFSTATFGWFAGSVLIQVTLPWSMASTMLVAFYWSELLEKTTGGQGIRFLQGQKWPYFIIVIVLQGMNLFSGISLGLLLPVVNQIFVISGLFYALSQLIAGIHFVYNGWQIKVKLEALGRNASDDNRRAILRRMNGHITIAGAGMLVFCAIAFCAVVPYATFYPVSYATLFAGLFTAVQVISISQISAFQTPTAKRDHTTRSRTPSQGGGSRDSVDGSKVVGAVSTARGLGSGGGSYRSRAHNRANSTLSNQLPKESAATMNGAGSAIGGGGGGGLSPQAVELEIVPDGEVIRSGSGRAAVVVMMSAAAGVGGVAAAASYDDDNESDDNGVSGVVKPTVSRSHQARLSATSADMLMEQESGPTTGATAAAAPTTAALT